MWKPREVRPEFLARIRCVVFDVGETLVDETRIWADLALWVGSTPLTVCGVLGAVIAQGGVEDLLRHAGLNADFVASSAAWGVAKPDRGFFSRVVDEAKVSAGHILYVGDRLDNDVLPARAAGMRTGFIRRGPWGYLHSLKPEAALADLRIHTLLELTELLSLPDSI